MSDNVKPEGAQNLAMIHSICRRWTSNSDIFFTIDATEALTIRGRLPNLFQHVEHLEVATPERACRFRIYMVFYFRLSELISTQQHFEIVRAQYPTTDFEKFKHRMSGWRCRGKVLDSLCKSLGSHGAIFYFPSEING